MNLIINANPKDDTRSLSAALSLRLAERLEGQTQMIRIYESDQKYFHYQHNQEWINLVVSAQSIILPVQMWNFTIPAALKDFFDKITKQGQLWELSSDQRFIGLLKDRPVYVIMTSGLDYPPGSPQDFVVPYLKVFFEFLGIRNLKDFRVGHVANSARLITDHRYMEEKSQAMFKAFGLLNEDQV